MFGLDPATVALTVVVLTFAGFVKGVVGFAVPVMAVGVLSSFMPVPTVLAIIIVPILIANLWQALSTGHVFATMKRFWPVIASLSVTLWFSAKMVVHLDQATLYGFVGVAVLLFSITAFLPTVPPLPPRLEPWVGPLAGMIGGFLGGVSAIWAPPVMMFYIMLHLGKDEFVRTCAMSWFVAAIPMTIAHTRTGVLTWESGIMSLAASVPVMAGMLIGERLRSRINQALFRKLVLATSFLIGLNLLRRAFF